MDSLSFELRLAAAQCGKPVAFRLRSVFRRGLASQIQTIFRKGGAFPHCAAA